MDPRAQLNWVAFLHAMAERTVYFKDDFEDAAFRSGPNGDIYVKLRGKSEFLSVPGSKLVAEAMLVHDEITEQEYQAFA